MPSVTYLNTDGEIQRFGGRENHTTAVIFYDRSANVMVHGVPAGASWGFDVGSSRVLTLSAAGAIQGCGPLDVNDTCAGATSNILDLYHNSASPADNDEMQVRFYHNDSACAKVEFGRLSHVLLDTTACTKDSRFTWDIMVGNTLLNDVFKFGASAAGGTLEMIINEDGDDLDFRVEGDNNANLVTTDGATDSLGFGTAVVTGSAIAFSHGSVARSPVTAVGRLFHQAADAIAGCTAACATVAVVTNNYFGIPTYTETNASVTYTDLSTIHVAGAPVDSTNVTGTRKYGILVETGGLGLGIPGGTTGCLRIAGGTSGVVTVNVAAAAGTWAMTLPTGAGCCGQQLTTNGSGVTSWAAASSAALKNLHGITCKFAAYDRVRNVNVYDYTYNEDAAKGGYWTNGGQMLTGIVAEEAPWAMQGRKLGAFSPINAFGNLTAAFQVLAERVEALEAQA